MWDDYDSQGWGEYVNNTKISDKEKSENKICGAISEYDISERRRLTMSVWLWSLAGKDLDNEEGNAWPWNVSWRYV